MHVIIKEYTEIEKKNCEENETKKCLLTVRSMNDTGTS